MVTATEEKQVLYCGYPFDRDMFSSDLSWWKFTNGKPLKDRDFVEKDDYTKYFLLGMELVDWATVVITGQKGAGKSLFMVWLSATLREFFGKGVTLNFHPNEGSYATREGFGDYFYLTEQSLLDENVKLTHLADSKEANKLTDQTGYLTAVSPLYNHIIGLDEARKWLGKLKQTTRMAQVLMELKDLARHYHDVFLYSMPNALEELGKYTVLNDRTHEIHCSFNTHYWGCASYCIKHMNSGRIRWMHLSAKKYSYLWNSWNLIGMSKPITAKQMKDAQMRARGEPNMSGRKLVEEIAEREFATNTRES